MLHYDRIDLGEGIDTTKSRNSKQCMVCHNWFLDHGYKF